MVADRHDEDPMMTAMLVMVATIVASTYLAGRMAEARGRSVSGWQWVAALLLGPLAPAVLYALPPVRRGAS